MSCENCDTKQDDPNSGIAYYRWKNANIAIDGCKEHLLEIFDALSMAQANMREDDMKMCQDCRRTLPNSLINAFIEDDKAVQDLCAICALVRRNKAAGLPEDAMFTGELAKNFYERTLLYYEKTNQA